jgi:hypothetical protein
MWLKNADKALHAGKSWASSGRIVLDLSIERATWWMLFWVLENKQKKFFESEG